MDRYLLESGSPDGYQLEDASGVLLLEGGAGDAPTNTGLMDFWGALPVLVLPVVFTFLAMRLR